MIISNTGKICFGCLILACLTGWGREGSLRDYIEAELAKGRKEITIPPGRYEQPARGGAHLTFSNLKDVHIMATGVEMLCTAPHGRAILIDGCEGFQITGLTIDYAPLPFTQGEITSISEDGRVHEIRLFEGYPRADQVKNFKYEIFNPRSRLLRCDTYYPEKVEVIDEDRIRVSKPENRYGGKPFLERVGDWIVIGAGDFRGKHAIHARNSRQLKLSGLTVYASPVFGVLEVACDASVYDGVKITRRPLEDDYRPREMGRLRSLNADGLHSKSAARGPRYLNCEIKYNGDDSIAINGHYHVVSSSEGPVLRVIGKRIRQFDIEAGDSVQLVTPAGEPLPDAVVVSIRQAGQIQPDEVEWLSKMRLHPKVKPSKNILREAYEVVLDRKIDMPPGTFIASNNRTGSGFQIIGCDIGYNRARGLMIKAGNGVISDNTISHTWREGIKLAPEEYWLEAGRSRNIEISRNSIEYCQGPGIAVFAISFTPPRPAPPGMHSDIRITDNTIRHCFKTSIFITSARDVLLEGNRISGPSTGEALPFTNRFRSAAGPLGPIGLINVENIKGAEFQK